MVKDYSAVLCSNCFVPSLVGAKNMELCLAILILSITLKHTLFVLRHDRKTGIIYFAQWELLKNDYHKNTTNNSYKKPQKDKKYKKNKKLSKSNLD